MAQFVDTVTGHVVLMCLFLGGAIGLWWGGFPGPESAPAALWTLGTAIAGRVTAKTGDGK